MEDYLVRAIAANGQVRAFAAYTKNTVETARQAHNTSPVVTAGLGRLLTAGAMMGSMMKGDRDVLTIKAEGSGPVGHYLVTADSKGNVKGYAANPNVILPANAAGKLDVGGSLGVGLLTVIKDLGLKEPYTGTCELVSGEIAEDLTYYFASSEQTPSSVGLGVLMTKDNTVNVAGGFIIQLMPDATEETISIVEEKISTIKSVTSMLENGLDPEGIINLILGGLDPEILDKMPVRFYCNCSKERVSKALIAIGRKELDNIIEENEPIEVKCHFCNKAYNFTVDELKKLV
ncbi:Hsp33 family molecular chaperone HslO [Eshraghiella crossota]|jgi:molecular chaperone Hsp33|nr:Hsp33 family molecular chaperone HslO [Butyrivibrio crossotus]MBD9030372.1 Hsp33 family molecular chaperone HslO [Butyrivibrio crossotus]MBS6452903.1 Hsp33 family molecular chaperone HslO [Butyrivibrio sp.]UWO50170.1 Hsp33 family molecular chaperone HslO [Butyrivibrio crossotus]